MESEFFGKTSDSNPERHLQFTCEMHIINMYLIRENSEKLHNRTGLCIICIKS